MVNFTVQNEEKRVLDCTTEHLKLKMFWGARPKPPQQEEDTPLPHSPPRRVNAT